MSAECRRLRGPSDTGPACSCSRGTCAIGVVEPEGAAHRETRARITALALVETPARAHETGSGAFLNRHLNELAAEYLKLLQEREAGSWGPHLADDCIENGRVLVVQHVRPDGGMGRYVGTKGDLPISQFVGLLHIGAYQLMHEAARLEERE